MRMITLALTTMLAMAAGGCPATGGNSDDPTAVGVSIGSGFVQTVRTGTVAGATEFDATCQGFFPATAQHTLSIEASQAMSISVSGSENAVVRVVAGASNFCGDDDDDLMRFWTRGDSQVFVGSTVDGESFDYTLTFTAN